MKVPNWLCNWIENRYKHLLNTPPDENVGGTDQNPYMSRWHIVRVYRVFNIYLHQFHHSDDDRARHNHPWWSISLLLRGNYNENMCSGTHYRQEHHAYARSASTFHKVELLPTGQGGEIPCTTLFITGPKIRTWGFECPQGFRPWQKFVAPRGGDEIGSMGCD